ncbi:MAG: hypothetical protein ACJ74Y_17310 [Bryobacteraceae bacterium]
MNFRTALKSAGCVFFILCAVVAAPAATITVTYELTVTGSGDPTNPPLIGNGTGSISPLGNLIWRDMGFPNFATGLLTGTFTATFANGTLFGNLFEQADLSAPPNATPAVQTLEVTGGTGAFLWYNGTLTGTAIANFVDPVPFTPSGSGTLNTTPEPAAIALLPMGLLCLVAYRKLGGAKVKFLRCSNRATTGA